MHLRGAREFENVVGRARYAPSADELIVRAEGGRRVIDALLSLDEPYKRTLLLRYLEELPPAEIALRLQVPVSTVKTRLQRGLAQLHGALDPAQPQTGDTRASAPAWLVAVAGFSPRSGPGAAGPPSGFVHNKPDASRSQS